MIDVKRGLKQVSDKKAWQARGASFVVKLKATKAVWFPPDPVGKGEDTARATAKAAAGSTKKAGGKTAKKAAKKSAGAKAAAGGAKKRTSAAKKTATKKATAKKSA